MRLEFFKLQFDESRGTFDDTDLRAKVDSAGRGNQPAEGELNSWTFSVPLETHR